jgi:Domain of unknown function (DUF4421)
LNLIKLYILIFVVGYQPFLFAQVNVAAIEIDSNTKKPDTLVLSKKDSLRIQYPWGFDTNYVRRYNERIAISIFQSQRTFELNMSQTGMSDPSAKSTLQYIARSNKATGFSVAYDKISFSLAYTTPLPEAEIKKKGKTKYSDYSFAFTSYRYRLEMAYRNYQGFYEGNTANYDTNYTDTSAFYKRPELKNLVLKTRLIYFFNKRKFSYSAAYSNTYRQMKTKGSWYVYTDLFYNSLTDPTGFLPPQVENYYQDYRKFNLMEAYGLSLGGGYSLNIVMFKSLYVNGTFGLAGQFYQQNTKTADGVINNSIFKAGITGADVRGAVGYNGKNFFIRATLLVDVTVFKVGKINIGSQLIGGSFAYGYRFRFKERRWVTKMKNNKLYKIL